MINPSMLFLVAALQGPAADVVLDDFESTAGWTTAPSDGVSLSLHDFACLGHVMLHAC